MLYCTKCVKFHGTQMEGEKACHKCKGEVIEITSAKLHETINNLTDAMKKLETTKENPRQLITIAKSIEKGEKVFRKEYEKRVTQLESIQQELSLIQNFSDKMGYKLEG